MKKLTNYLSYLLKGKDNSNLESVFIKSFKMNNILDKMILFVIMFFCFTAVSFGQNFTFNSSSHKNTHKNSNSTSYKYRVLKDAQYWPNEELEISEKLRTEKELPQVTINKISYIPSTYFVENFKMNFPKAQNVIWSKTDLYEEADFTMNKSKMSAFYDRNNNLNSTLIGTAKYVAYKSLPARAIRYIARNYKDFVPEK